MLTEQKGIQVDKFYPPKDWQYSFPEGYTRLEYLESVLYPYINTGIAGNSLYNYEIEYQCVNSGDRVFLCGVDETFSLKSSTFIRLSNGNLSWYYDTYGTILFNNPNYNTVKNKIEVLYDINLNTVTTNIYNNGTKIKTTQRTIADIYNGNFYLGALNRNGSAVFDGTKRFYSAKFYNGTTLVRNFVPVKRNSDNKPGMLDLANVDASGNYVFYTNAGSGEFVMGPELYSNNSQIDIRQKNNTNFVEKYKFNENNELIWANPQLNLSGPVNYSVVGNPTITDNVVSGFSNNNYLKLQNNLTLSNDMELEINIRFKTPSELGTTNQYLFGANASDYSGYIGISYKASTGQFETRLPNVTGGSYTTYTMTANTYYSVKSVVKNNTVQTLLYDANNVLLAQTTVKTFSANWSYATQLLTLGLKTDIINSLVLGAIDLKETYIKVNNKLWFYGKNYTSENYAPVPAGLNYNNTTTPSIGYVNTQTQEFIPAPTDGIKYSQTRDIKVIPPEDNTITLLYGVKSDFSKYSLFGLLADTSSGTYDVYIDDVLYATTTKNTQTDIDFSALGNEYVSIGTCTTPEELVLHKIVIKPTTSGQTIIKITHKRNTNSNTENTISLLWVHFELNNDINLEGFLYSWQYYKIINIFAITAKNDILNIRSINIPFYFATVNNDFNYLPEITMPSNQHLMYELIDNTTKLKRVRLKDIICNTEAAGTFARNVGLEQIAINDVKIENATATRQIFRDNRKLKSILDIKYNNSINCTDLITNAMELYPTKLDISKGKNITIIGTYGTSSYPMRGLRGLKVSNEAPFTGTSPQINVSYTGLDRDALVELFESMPGYMKLDKVGELTIDSNGVASGFSTSDYLEIQGLHNFSQPFEVVMKIKTGVSNASGFLRIKNENYGHFVAIVGSGQSIGVWSGNTNNETIANGVSTPAGSVPHNTEKFVKFAFTGTQYIIALSDDGESWTTTNTINNSTVIGDKATIIIGANPPANQYFNGSIDLKNSYIKINNARYQFQLPDDTTTRAINITAATGNNLTKVGTPTIDENGVASGFSSANYLQNNNTISQDVTNFVIRFKFSLASSQGTSTNGQLFYFGGVSTMYIARLIWSETYRNPVIYLYDWTTQTLKSQSLGYTLDRDTNYILEVLFNNGTGTYNVYNESGTLLKSVAISGDFNLKTTNKIVIGKTDDVGNIYLENTYIKVGNNYIMKGYLTDNDRLIATNKGWGITG